MNHLFVPYEIALQLKEKGFNELCFAIYENRRLFLRYKSINSKLKRVVKLDKRIDELLISAPLYQQAIDWLFKKLDFYYPYLNIEIFSDSSGNWHHPADDGNDALNIDFDNLDQAITEALKLI